MFILRVFLILGLCVIHTSIQTLIPRHNSIVYPEYWYEGMIAFVFAVSIPNGANMLLDFYCITGEKSSLVSHLLCKLMCSFAITFIASHCLCDLIWTVYLGQYRPLPFIGLSGFISVLLTYGLFWFKYTKKLREEPKVNKKIRYFIKYKLWLLFLQFQNNGVSMIFKKLPSNLQWLISIMIPILKNFNHWMLSRFIIRIAGANDEMANFIVATDIMGIYNLYIAVQLITASDITIYCILAVELVLHIRSCYQIIKMYRKVETVNDRMMNLSLRKRTAILNLLVAELVEGLVPLAFSAAFTTAYYGPNAFLIKNVRSNYFGGIEVKDLNNFYTSLFQMFGIDICAMIISVCSLRYFCKIDLMKYLYDLIEKYWWIMGIKLSLRIAIFFCYNDLNGAMDYTLKFAWISENGRLDLIRNANDLSLNEKLHFLNYTIMN